MTVRSRQEKLLTVLFLKKLVASLRSRSEPSSLDERSSIFFGLKGMNEGYRIVAGGGRNLEVWESLR